MLIEVTDSTIHNAGVLGAELDEMRKLLAAPVEAANVEQVRRWMGSSLRPYLNQVNTAQPVTDELLDADLDRVDPEAMGRVQRQLMSILEVPSYQNWSTERCLDEVRARFNEFPMRIARAKSEAKREAFRLAAKDAEPAEEELNELRAKVEEQEQLLATFRTVFEDINSSLAKAVSAQRRNTEYYITTGNRETDLSRRH